MTSSRRRVLVAGATGTLALTAGCLDFALGNGPLELTADRAAPTDAALAETGYEEHEIDEQSIDETIEVGVERDVRASVRTSVYSKTVEHRGVEHEGCFFAAVSIPDVSVLDRSFNPIAQMSTEELLEEFLDHLEGDHGSLENLSHRESFTLEILGEGRDVDVFESESDLEGEPIDVDVAVTAFGHEDDLLVLLGSYPAALVAESANAEVLMESVEHPV